MRHSAALAMAVPFGTHCDVVAPVADAPFSEAVSISWGNASS